MEFICDAADKKTWFRIETDVEAEQESRLMDHAVKKHFLIEQEKAASTYTPTSSIYIEQNIGLKAHIQREMALFLTLRDAEGGGLATAMLPPGAKDNPDFRIVIVGVGNRDPYPDHEAAIRSLGAHYGLSLDRERCFPYNR